MRVLSRCRKGGTWRCGSASSDVENVRGWIVGVGAAFSTSVDMGAVIAAGVVSLRCFGVDAAIRNAECGGLRFGAGATGKRQGREAVHVP